MNGLKLFSDRPNFRRAFQGFSYFFSEKMIRIVVGFILQTWLARYLGPEQMGKYSFVADFTAIFIPFVLFGLDDFAVRDLLKTDDPGKVLGTIFYFRLSLGVIAWSMLAIAIYFARKESPEIVWLTVAYGSLVVFRSFDTFTVYFHSHYLIKPLIKGRQIVFCLFSAARAGGLMIQVGLNYFLFNTWIQMIFEKIIPFFQLRSMKKMRFTFDQDYLKSLIPIALPIALTGFFSYGETRLGTFFLNKYNTLDTVGEFSVGRGLLDLWEFIPISICLTVFPVIVSSKSNDIANYQAKLRKLYGGLFYLGAAFAISVTLSSSWVINILYGARYDQTDKVLSCGSWFALITYLNLARVKWYILEGKTQAWLALSAVNFILNVILQFYFTPGYGIIGPYLASISSHLIGNVALALFNKSIREDLKNVFHGILLPLTYLMKR